MIAPGPWGNRDQGCKLCTEFVAEPKCDRPSAWGNSELDCKACAEFAVEPKCDHPSFLGKLCTGLQVMY